MGLYGRHLPDTRSQSRRLASLLTLRLRKGSFIIGERLRKARVKVGDGLHHIKDCIQSRGCTLGCDLKRWLYCFLLRWSRGRRPTLQPWSANLKAICEGRKKNYYKRPVWIVEEDLLYRHRKTNTMYVVKTCQQGSVVEAYGPSSLRQLHRLRDAGTVS